MSELDQVEKLLLLYSQAVDELQEAEEEYRERRKVMYSPSAQKFDTVHTEQLFYDHRSDKQLLHLEQMEKEIEEKRKNAEMQKAITEAAIKAICWRTETRASIVMRFYYINLWSEEQIARELYSDKWKNPENHRGLLRKVRRDRERGIRMLERALPTEEHFHAGAGVLPDMALFGDWWRESEKER